MSQARRGPWKRWLLAGGLAVAIGLAMAQAGVMGGAGVGHYLLQRHLVHWSEAGSLPDGAAREKGEAIYYWAQGLAPSDPGLAQIGGRLAEWRAVAAEPPKQRYRALRQARALYQRSLRQRPSWPHAWAGLALTLARAGEYGPEFQQSLQRALALGPWQPEVQLDIARAGFEAGPQLQPKTRQALVQSLRRAARRQPRKLLRTARTNGGLLLLCYAVPNQEQVGDQCRKAEIF